MKQSTSGAFFTPGETFHQRSSTISTIDSSKDQPTDRPIYAEHEALIRIDDGSTIRGDLPRTAERLVEQWRTLHHDELLANWILAQAPSALTRIEPLQ